MIGLRLAGAGSTTSEPASKPATREARDRTGDCPAGAGRCLLDGAVPGRIAGVHVLHMVVVPGRVGRWCTQGGVHRQGTDRQGSPGPVHHLGTHWAG